MKTSSSPLSRKISWQTSFLSFRARTQFQRQRLAMQSQNWPESHRAAQRGHTHIAPLSSHRLGTVSRSVASSNTERLLLRCLRALKVGCECDGLVALAPCDPFGRGTVPSRAATVKARVGKLSSPLNSGRPGCPASAMGTEQEENSAGERSPDRQPPPPEEKLR